MERRLFFPLRELGRPIYTRQLETGKDIYGKRRFVGLVLYHPRLWPACLVIWCKWQASAGSVGQKFPFEVLSIQQDEYDTIILLDGSGYAPGAKQWLVNQAGKNRLKHVFNQGQFARFANRANSRVVLYMIPYIYPEMGIYYPVRRKVIRIGRKGNLSQGTYPSISQPYRSNLKSKLSKSYCRRQSGGPATSEGGAWRRNIALVSDSTCSLT